MTLCVTIEFGSAFLRAGFGGQSEPRVEIPFRFSETVEVSYDCDENSTSGSSLCLRSPCFSELEWEQKLSPLLDEVYRKLLVRALSFRVVLILPPLAVNTSEDERRTWPQCRALERVLLEYLQVPVITYVDADLAASFALGRIQSSLSLSSSPGSCSLLSVDIGRDETRCVCLHNGATLFETLQIMPCGYNSLLQSILLSWNHLRHGEVTGQALSSQALPSETDWDYQYAQFFITTFQLDHTTNIFAQPIISLLHKSSSMNGVVESAILEKIAHDCIKKFYFSFDNPHSLLRGFLDTALACPIDLRRFMIKNVVFIGESVLQIPNIEQYFYTIVTQLFSSKEILVPLPSPVADMTWNKYSSLIPVLKSLSIMFPLPFSPKHVVWIGGGILGNMMSSFSDNSSSTFVHWVTMATRKVSLHY